MTITRTNYNALREYLAYTCPADQLAKAMSRLQRMTIVD